MRGYLSVGALLAASVALSACGQTPGCRALTGAGVGAAGGALIGAVAGNPGAGAVAGGVAGAATGALTSPGAVNGPSPCY